MFRLGEPHETWADRYDYMFCARMRPLHALITVAGVVAAASVSVYLLFRFDDPELAVYAGVPVVVFAWWLGWFIARPKQDIPRPCPTCRRDLRGVTEPRSPECGTLLVE